MYNTGHFLFRPFAWLLFATATALVTGQARAAVVGLSNPALVPAAQTFSESPGTPDSFDNPGGTQVVIDEGASSPNPVAVGAGSMFNITTAAAGDIIFLNDPNGGDVPSNYGAILRFLNPADPTGTLGLEATEKEAFLAVDLGPGGFANFALLPNDLFVDVFNTADPHNYIGSATEFGPVGGIMPARRRFLSIEPTMRPCRNLARWQSSSSAGPDWPQERTCAVESC